jgi:hypothetical protein
MAKSLKEILENVKDIYMSDSSLEALMDMERVLDDLNLYAFKNWKKGELVAGPQFEKYFISATFMWPHRKMPDPRGGQRLLDYRCQVTYHQDKLEFPIKVRNYDDFRPGTKVPRLGSVDVWLVTITMPKSLMKDIKRGAVELENETIDMEDIEDAYEQGLDQDQFKTQEQQDAEKNKSAEI